VDRIRPGVIAAIVSFGVPASAGATWSIVAVDPQTQEVGVAVASCVEAPFGTTLLPEVVGLAPGQGALAAQALLSQQYRDQAVALLTAGNSPQDVIDMVVDADPGSASRQYGVVTLDGQTATFTGAAANDWAGDLQGENVTAQGNILYGPEVVGDALTAFEADAPSCPWTLADRLMLALEAGAAQGGDNRCSEEQSALAAVLKVARPEDAKGTPYLDLRIPSEPHDGDNPVVLLRAAYDEWRVANPPDDAGCVGGTGSTGGEDSGDATSSSSTSEGGDASDTTSGDASTTNATTSSSTTNDDGAPPPATDTDGAAAGDADAGCGCTHAPGAPLWALVLLPLLRRRRVSACETD
jgi:uncharacterized protein (TIGR03382 family)